MRASTDIPRRRTISRSKDLRALALATDRGNPSRGCEARSCLWSARFMSHIVTHVGSNCNSGCRSFVQTFTCTIIGSLKRSTGA